MYDGFYNLIKKPFQLSADTDFFFNSAVHKRALAYMRYGLTQGEGFVVIIGKPGTGKPKPRRPLGNPEVKPAPKAEAKENEMVKKIVDRFKSKK